MAVHLTTDQRRAVENTGGPLLVSAAAGAGKTRVLVERLLDRICAGADVDEFLVITFTNAAAAELRDRVAKTLGERLAQHPQDRHLRRQLTLVYRAHISTIHSFCGELLRTWGHLMDLDPDFRLMEDGESQVLQGEALTELLDRHYQNPTEELGLLLDVFSSVRDDRALGNMVLDIYRKLQSHSAPAQWLEEQKTAFDLSTVTDPAQTAWGAYLLQHLRKLAGYWHGILTDQIRECELGVPGYVSSLAVTVANLAVLAGAATWSQGRLPEFPRLGSSAKCPDPALAEGVKQLWNDCKDQMKKAAEPFDTPGDVLMEDLRLLAPAMVGLLDLVGEFSAQYSALKAKRGVLDFNDLEHMTLRLLTDHPELAEETRFREVMVDEYQDTNQVQNAIFDILTPQGNLFMVGDVKQSIYRFRLADPTIFLDKYTRYPDSTQAVAGAGRKVNLGENFRSRPEVISCVNFLFENLMSSRLGDLDYGPEEALKVGRREPGKEFPEREDCHCEFYLISKSDHDEDTDNSEVEPRLIARRLRQLLDEGFPVTGKDGEMRPVQPGDMAILLRAPYNVLGYYADAMTEYGIPWESEGGEDFFDTPEVAVALSYLEIIDNPRQDVPLIAVLRSPLWGFTPDRLAQLRRSKEKEGNYYDTLIRDGGEDCKTFLAELEDLRLLSQDARSYEVLWEVYRRTGMLAAYSAMPGGAERRLHLLELLNYARRFEKGGHKGLFGFLNHLRRRRDQGERLSVPGGETGTGVQVLSIHRSKGLEYPVVVVAGLGKRLNHADATAPMLFHRDLGLGPKGLDLQRSVRYPTLARWAVARKLEDEMRSEEMRLLYVALTRAQEKLIMTCAVKDPEREVEKLLPYATLPADPEMLSRLSTVGQWVLTAALCRPESAGTLRPNSPLPHTPPANVNWGWEWIMDVVAGDPQQWSGVPLKHPSVTSSAPVCHPDWTWQYPYMTASQLPSKLTATQMKGRELDEEVHEDAEIARKPVIFDRPDFALERGLTPGERGTAHHLVMQYLNFEKTASLENIEDEIARISQMQLVTPQQAAAVDPKVIYAFFCSEIGEKIRKTPENIHREFKFSVLAPAEKYYPQLPPGQETVLLQGVVDCWFETPEGLVILDFKSDRVTETTVGERAEEYRPQLEAYADALSQLLGKPIARKVLWFFSLNRAVEL